MSPRLILMRSHRTAALAAGFTLVVAACGGGDADSALPADGSQTTQASQTTSTTPNSAVETTQPSTTRAAAGSDETLPEAQERPAPDPDREIAPDFTLALGNGSTFVLSEETRPVFMVFWAEW
jgi:hypothetical protein